MQSSVDTILLNWVVIKRLLIGLTFNFEVAALAVLVSIIFGTLIGILRTLPWPILNFFLKLHLEIVRVLPTLVLLFIFYFIVPELLDLEISGLLIGVVAFSVWGSAEMGDIVRSAIITIPPHQIESAKALALNKWQIYRYILLPQSLRIAVPPSLNLFNRIIMTTSLLVLIGIRDVVKVGKEIIEYYSFTNDLAPFIIYGVILLVFFAICYPLSKAAKILEQHWEVTY